MVVGVASQLCFALLQIPSSNDLTGTCHLELFNYTVVSIKKCSGAHKD